ncbi:MAG: hypothetical protein ACM3Y8_13335, partial [Byssovorax cruenta]
MCQTDALACQIGHEFVCQKATGVLADGFEPHENRFTVESLFAEILRDFFSDPDDLAVGPAMPFENFSVIIAMSSSFTFSLPESKCKGAVQSSEHPKRKTAAHSKWL